MPFIWNWIWEKLRGIGKTPTQPQGLDSPKVDNQVGQKIVRNRRAVSAKKGDTGFKPKRVRSNNTSKTGRKSAGKTVCAAASKGKAKGKAVPKG